MPNETAAETKETAATTTTPPAPTETKAGDAAATKTPEAKADGGKTTETKDSTSSTPAKVVPEKYDLKTGERSFLDAEDLDGIATIARERGLSQEEAQTLLVNHEKQVAARVDRQAKAWLEQSRNDKEIGGQKYEEALAHATRLVERFGSPALKEELNRSGFGNHPEWIRVFARIGKEFADDKAVIPGATTGGANAKPLEEKLYPTMFESKQ